MPADKLLRIERARQVMAKLPKNILIVDSDAATPGPLIGPLEKMKVEVFSAADLQTAFYRYNKQFFRVVVLELDFSELDALSIIQKWRQHEVIEKRSAGFIVMSKKSPSEEQLALIREMGSIQIITKPLSVGPLISQLEKAFTTHTKLELKRKIKTEIYDRIENGDDVTDIIKSIHDYKEALGKDYFILLVDLYQRVENYEDALNLINKAPPGLLEPLTKLNLQGSLNLKIGNFAEAKKAFEMADRQAPRNIERIGWMVELYLKANHSDKAVLKQKELMALNPENPELKYSLFQHLEEAGFVDEAAAFCQETTGPMEVVKFFNNKGVVLVKSQEIKSAIIEYNRALTYQPNNKHNYLVHFNIALAYLRTKQSRFFAKAMHHLECCLSLKPDYEKGLALRQRLLAVKTHAS